MAWTEGVSTFVNAQSVLDQSENSAMEDMVGIGFNLRASEKLDVLGEAFSDGDNDGTRLGLAYRYRENSSAYLNYVTERSDLARDGITLGQKTSVTDRLRVYNEHGLIAVVDKMSRVIVMGSVTIFRKHGPSMATF